MKKQAALHSIISILLMLSVVNCYLEVPIEELETQSVEIMEEDMNDFIVKPFEEYPAYYQNGSNVFGIPLNSKGPTDLVIITPDIEIDGETQRYRFNEFFVKDGKSHFKIVVQFPNLDDPTNPEIITKYCTLTAGKVVYLTETKFPAMPISERVEGETEVYTIGLDTYNGDLISIASRTKIDEDKIVPDYAENFMMIDGFIKIEGGLLIHTPTGRGSSRPAGLLFWPEGLRTMNSWKEVGRFWK